MAARRVLLGALVPVGTACFVFDGIVSHLRAYSLDEWGEMVETLDGTGGFTWRLSQVPSAPGLGGRPITKRSLAKVFAEARQDDGGLTTFRDLDAPLVERVLESERRTRRSGPLPELVLKERHAVPAR